MFFFYNLRIIISCAVLHNICKDLNIPIPDDYPVIQEDDQNDDNNNMNAGVAQNGLRYRDQIANRSTYF